MRKILVSLGKQVVPGFLERRCLRRFAQTSEYRRVYFILAFFAIQPTGCSRVCELSWHPQGVPLHFCLCRALHIVAPLACDRYITYFSGTFTRPTGFFHPADLAKRLDRPLPYDD